MKNPHERRNGGYYRDTVSLILTKTVTDSENNLLDIDQPFVFEITLRQAANENWIMYNGPALINDEEVTVSGGVVTLTHSDVLRIDGLKKFTDYRIRERNIPNYETYI